MVQRTAAVPQTGGVADGIGHIFLGALHGLGMETPSARLEAIAEDRVQPVPCVLVVLIWPSS